MLRNLIDVIAHDAGAVDISNGIGLTVIETSSLNMFVNLKLSTSSEHNSFKQSQTWMRK